MEMNYNLKNLANFFKFSLCILDKLLKPDLRRNQRGYRLYCDENIRSVLFCYFRWLQARLYLHLFKT